MALRRALLIADLEGIGGVDAVEDIVYGAPGHGRAREWMTDEVLLVATALRDAGYDAVRVVDSHLSGSGTANLDASALPSFVELRFESDAYAAELFEGVDAVACVGMHAAAGTDGFGAHTVDVTARWREGRRSLSELDLVMALAANRAVPFLFASGDDVLARSAARLPFVQTKTALSVRQARSRRRSFVRSDLRRAAALPATKLRPQKRPRALTLDFKRPEWTRAAAAYGRSSPPDSVRFEGSSFEDAYRAALAGTQAASSRIQLDAPPGTAEFVAAAIDLLDPRTQPRRP